MMTRGFGGDKVTLFIHRLINTQKYTKWTPLHPLQSCYFLVVLRISAILWKQTPQRLELLEEHLDGAQLDSLDQVLPVCGPLWYKPS